MANAYRGHSGARWNDLGRDGGNLGWRLTQPEHHFWKPLAERPVVIDAREAQIGEWLVAKRLGQAIFGIADVQRSAGNFPKQFVQFGRIHGDKDAPVI